MLQGIAGVGRHVFALSCALALGTYSVILRGSDYALMVPGASHSLLLDIAAAGERLVEVGERGHILYSDDHGQNWIQARVPTSEMLTRVFFIDAARGWAVGHDGNVLSTGDGGVQWELQREGLSAQIRINELHPVHARESAVEPLFPPPLMSVWFSNASRGWAAGAFGTLLQTTDGGRHWNDRAGRVDNPDELHFNAVAGDRAGNLYLASEWGTVFRSSNGGESWEARETGYDGSFFGVLVSPASNSVFAYGVQGTVYRSRDRGENWQALDTPGRDSLFGATCSGEGTLLFVGDNGRAIASSDDGERFAVLATPDRRKLTGVTALGGGRFAATGEGGSIALSTMPPAGR